MLPSELRAKGGCKWCPSAWGVEGAYTSDWRACAPRVANWFVAHWLKGKLRVATCDSMRCRWLFSLLSKYVYLQDTQIQIQIQLRLHCYFATLFLFTCRIFRAKINICLIFATVCKLRQLRILVWFWRLFFCCCYVWAYPLANSFAIACVSVSSCAYV